MNIVFFCKSCGARFEVPESAAGKRGRCKKCGQISPIPRATELGSMVAMPALAASLAAGPRVAAAAAGPNRTGSWIATVNSSVGLAPLTVDRLPVGGMKQVKPRSKWEDDPDDAKPYVVMAERGLDHHGAVGKPVSAVKMLWRKELGIVQKIFRWLNETAYLVSVPFLMMIVLGALSRNRPLALIGATVVVLLNIGRIVSGLANLVVIPFRDGISQGVMFLIPPLTFIYLSNHWSKLRKPTLRVVWPVITIFLVVIAFTFVPSLRQGGAQSGDLKSRLVESAKGLEKEIEGEVDKAKSLDVNTLESQAEAKARELRDSLRDSADDNTSPRPKSKAKGKSKSPEDAVQGLLEDVEKRARETIEESGKTP